MQLMGPDRPCRRAASRRWYGPWRCAWCRHRRPSAVCQHLRKAHRQLPFEPAWLLRPRLSLAWPPPLAPLRLRCLRLRRRLLPRLDRRRIPRMCSTRWPSIVDGSQDGSRQTRKARENVASLGSRPAPLQPHSRQSLPSTSRRSIRPRVVGMSRTAFEGARRRAVLLRTPYLAAEVGQKICQPAPVPEPRSS